VLVVCSPMLGVFICNPVMSLVDTAFVGASSSVELAALSPGTVLVRCLLPPQSRTSAACLTGATPTGE
jgi:Na+-driven multidrug efflux pump